MVSLQRDRFRPSLVYSSCNLSSSPVGVRSTFVVDFSLLISNLSAQLEAEHLAEEVLLGGPPHRGQGSSHMCAGTRAYCWCHQQTSYRAHFRLHVISRIHSWYSWITKWSFVQFLHHARWGKAKQSAWLRQTNSSNHSPKKSEEKSRCFCATEVPSALWWGWSSRHHWPSPLLGCDFPAWSP